MSLLFYDFNNSSSRRGPRKNLADDVIHEEDEHVDKARARPLLPKLAQAVSPARMQVKLQRAANEVTRI